MHRGYARSPLGISTIYSSASFLLLGVRSLVANVGLQRRPFEAEFVSMHAVATRTWEIYADQTSIINQATTILGYGTRILPRASPQAQTLPQPYTPRSTVLNGASGLSMLDGFKHRFAKHARKSSRPTQQVIRSRSGCSLLMRIEDDWRRRLRPARIRGLDSEIVGLSCLMPWAPELSPNPISTILLD